VSFTKNINLLQKEAARGVEPNIHDGEKLMHEVYSIPAM